MSIQLAYFSQYRRVAEAMAQDLREYADAALEAGEGIQATEALLAEFDEVSNLLNGLGEE